MRSPVRVSSLLFVPTILMQATEKSSVSLRIVVGVSPMSISSVSPLPETGATFPFQFPAVSSRPSPALPFQTQVFPATATMPATHIAADRIIPYGALLVIALFLSLLDKNSLKCVEIAVAKLVARLKVPALRPLVPGVDGYQLRHVGGDVRIGPRLCTSGEVLEVGGV